MIRRLAVLALLLSLLLCSSAATEIRPQQHARLLEALGRFDLTAVERSLREMERGEPAAFVRNNYDYLLARVLDRRGARDEAVPVYQQVVARRSPLAAYALWHLAEAARASGNFTEEQSRLAQLTAQHPDFLFREYALRRLGASYLKTGQYQQAITTLRTLSGTRGVTGRDSLAKVGEAQLALKEVPAARATFESVLAGGFMDDAALKAAMGLDQIDEAAHTNLTEAEHLRRARIYQVNRRFPEARAHWLAVVNNFPQSARRAEALFQLGRGYFWEENFPEAIRWYDRVHDELPRTDEGEQGFYYVGHAYQALNDADRAIARYEAFLKAYPQSEYVGTAHLNAIDTLRSTGRDEEALRWAARAQTSVRDPFIVITALFDQAKIRLTQGNFAAALADFTALRSRNLAVRGPVATTNASEVAFMRAYCLEQLGRFDEAINEYLALAEGRSNAHGYYGHRATERLRALAANLRAKNLVAARLDQYLAQARAAHQQGNAAAAKAAATQAGRLAGDEPTRREMLDILRTAYAKLPGYQLSSFSLTPVGRTAPLAEGAAPAADSGHRTLANELLFLGLYDEGMSELVAAGGSPAASREAADSMALY